MKKRRLTPEDWLESARNHLENARRILREWGELKDGHYWSMKYVRLAGHAGYNAVLDALHALMKARGEWSLKNGRPSADTYRMYLAGLNRKALAWFNTAYEILHLTMGYDGWASKNIAKEGFEAVQNIIEWVERMMPGRGGNKR